MARWASRLLALAVIAAGLACGYARGQSGDRAPSSAAADGPIASIRLPDFSGADPLDGQRRQIHVLVGRLLFINTLTRLRRVYVSNPAAIDSLTSSPTQVVITAKAPGVSSVVLWDENGHSQTYVISCDIDVEDLQRSLQQLLPGDPIEAVARQDRIVLSGAVSSGDAYAAAAKLAALYSKNTINALVVREPRRRQVKLKVQIVEIDRSKLEQFGVSFLSQGNNTSLTGTGQFSSVTTSSASTTTSTASPPLLTVSNPLNLLFYNSKTNMGMTIQDLENLQILQILAEPTITALSGQSASFLSGGEFPFPVIQGSSGGLTSITIQFRPYGVKLDFMPVVRMDGAIELQVSPEVSALDYTNAVSISGYTIPAISTRRAKTEVELRNGQSFAISGLLDRRTTDMLQKMPGIGDIPILGALFRSKSIDHSLVELVVIVTPTIVDPLTDTTPPALPKLPVPLLSDPKFDKTWNKQMGAPGKP
jgi:pilus assembly protein CpaC